MTDREKQIEEIILVVKEKMTDNASIDIVEDLVSFNGNDFDHIAEQTAEALYNAGYRKIPEGAVVLTKEEYEKLFKDGFGIMTSHIGDLEINPEGMRKAVDEIARLIRVQNELQVINAKYYNEAKDLRRNMRILRQASHSIEEVNYKTEEAKKETVREILKLTKEKCKELEDKYSHYCKSKKECLEETCRYEGVLAVKRELYELAKQYGVEVDE